MSTALINYSMFQTFEEAEKASINLWNKLFSDGTEVYNVISFAGKDGMNVVYVCHDITSHTVDCYRSLHNGSRKMFTVTNESVIMIIDDCQITFIPLSESMSDLKLHLIHEYYDNKVVVIKVE